MIAVNPTCMSFNCGRKPEYPRGEPTQQWGNMHLHTERLGNKLRTSWLWGGRDSHSSKKKKFTLCYTAEQQKWVRACGSASQVHAVWTYFSSVAMHLNPYRCVCVFNDVGPEFGQKATAAEINSTGWFSSLTAVLD